MHDQTILTIATQGQGLVEFTDSLRKVLRKTPIKQGLMHVFCQHTSCSLVIMENADPSACHDLEHYLNRLVPERQPEFTHTYEGDDDMPSHIKMALTRTSESLPIVDGDLALGTWQGVFLWEHRRMSHRRKIVVTLSGV